MDASPSSAMSVAQWTERESRERNVTCPVCGGAAPWQANPHRPFGSLTCRLVDLGVWLVEGYRFPADERGHVP